MFQTKVVEKIKTHILCSITFLENRALYEVKWKSTVEPERPQMTVWRMLRASCVPKATDIHSEYVILTAFPLQKWLHESASLLRLTYIVCLFSNIHLIQVHLGLSKGPLSFRFSHQNRLWISVRTSTCHRPSPADSPRSDHPNNTCMLRSASTETARYMILIILHSEI